MRQQLFDIVKEQDLFCLLLSPYAVESRWVHDEIEVAVNKDGLRILPVLLRPCRIPEKLENIVAFNASEGLDRDSVRHLLIRAIHGEDIIDRAILLDEAERDLLAVKETQNLAQQNLPEVEKLIASTNQSTNPQDQPGHLPRDPSRESRYCS